MRSPIVLGLIAGAAGTTALNVATYLDMAGRGRPSSSVPADAAAKLASGLGIPLGSGKEKTQREEGIGALLGYATGLGVGAAYGLLRTRMRAPFILAATGLATAAMIGGDVPMTALGLTDPRSWPASSWIADALPHLAYGVTAAAAYQSISR